MLRRGWMVDLMLHHWRMWKRIIAFCSWRRIQWRFFFFFLNLEILNFFKEFENFDWWFFFFLKQPKKYELNAPSPKAFFFFWKIWKSWIFSWNWNFWLMIFFEKFRNLEFFRRNWKFWLMIFFFLKQPKKYEPNAPSPKTFFENFLLFFFFFWKIWKSWIFLKELKILIDEFFFFWIFWRNWKFWLMFFFLENLSFEWE